MKIDFNEAAEMLKNCGDAYILTVSYTHLTLPTNSRV